MKNLKSFLLSLFAVCICYLIACHPEQSMIYARDAMDICCEMIIPSLFPFFICSGLLIYSGFCETLARVFKFCMRPVFNVSPAGSSAFILGIISGYPLGAVTAGELYRNNYLSKSEAERLLAFCNNSGPLFILASVGIALYSSIEYGIMLYVIHILASVTVGVIFRFYKRNTYHSLDAPVRTQKKSVGEIYSVSLQNALQTMLTVCGTVIFFSVISRLMLDMLPLSGLWNSLAAGVTEFVTGTVKIAGLDVNISKKLILTSIIVGFAGISVHMQVIAVIAKYQLSLIPYFLGKMLHGIIAGVYTWIYLSLHPLSRAVFAPSMGKGFAVSSVIEAAVVAVVAFACIVIGIRGHKEE